MSHASGTLMESLRAELNSRYSLNPTDQWLTPFFSTISRPPPLPALTSTAHFRLTSTDFTSTLVKRPPYLFPPGLGDVQNKATSLTNDIPVQILDIIDTGASKYSQIEGIERVERGEEIRGREVIRNVPGAADEDGGNDDSTAMRGRQSGTSTTNTTTKKGSTGPHKLLLQDAAGTKVWAFELRRIERITIINTGPSAPGATGPVSVDGMQIGCKILLRRGSSVRRGVIMLTPAQTVVMGGKVETWDKQWRDGRKARLQQELSANEALT